MPTTNLLDCVEPGVFEKAESILDGLDIPLEIALDMFLQEVVRQKGLPFEVETATLS